MNFKLCRTFFFWSHYPCSISYFTFCIPCFILHLLYHILHNVSNNIYCSPHSLYSMFYISTFHIPPSASYSMSYVSHSTFYYPCVIFYISYCTFCIPHSVFYASHFVTFHILQSILYIPHSVFHIQSTLFN